MAGTIAAEGNNGVGVAGVGWRTKIMPLKFLAPGYGFVSDAVEALDYSVKEGVKISNNSWVCGSCSGNPALSQTLRDAIQRVGDSGQLFVAAAGNEAKNTDLYPSYPSSYDMPHVVSVAATNNRDRLWASSYDPYVASNYGATDVDLAAPGDDVLSTAPGGGAALSEGTSMAAPHVSGVAALLKSTSPGLTHAEIKDRILQGAEKEPALAGKTATGGRLNAAAALGLELTELSSSATPTTLTYPAKATVSGKLTHYGEPLAGKQVILEKRPVGTTDYVTFATVTTDANGVFSGTSTPDKNADYRARFTGEPAIGLEASKSPATRLNVHVYVSISMYQTDLRLGTSRAIRGHVGPNHAGRNAILKVTKRGVGLVVNRYVKLDANSNYYTTYKPGSVGTYDVKVVYNADADNLGDASPVRTFQVVN